MLVVSDSYQQLILVMFHFGWEFLTKHLNFYLNLPTGDINLNMRILIFLYLG